MDKYESLLSTSEEIKYKTEEIDKGLLKKIDLSYLTLYSPKSVLEFKSVCRYKFRQTKYQSLLPLLQLIYLIEVPST